LDETAHFWLNDLVGRDTELATLLEHYRYVKNTHEVKIISIIAESGVGKTRLIREFYDQLVVNEDSNGYWPHKFKGDLLSLNLNPDLTNHSLPDIKNKKELPFLWWATRFTPTNSRNQTQSNMCGFLNSSSELEPHLAYLTQIKLLSDDKRSSVDLLLDTIIEFSPYAISDMVPGIGLTKAVISKSREAAARRKELKKISEAINKPEEVQKQQAIDFKSRVISGLEEIQHANNPEKADSRFPIIIVLDDAQWIDSHSLDVLLALLNSATKHKLPILVLMTAWQSSWGKTLTSPNDNAPLSILRNKISSTPSLKESLVELRLENIESPELLLKKGLPGLTCTQISMLIEKFGGDLFALDQCIEHLLGRPRLFINKDISNQLTDHGVNELKSFKHPRLDIIQKRFSELEDDVKDILGIASCQGYHFINQLVVNSAKKILQPNAGNIHLHLDDTLKKAESPLCFIQTISQNVAKFIDTANHQVSYRYFSEIPEDADAIRKATISEIDSWINKNKLESLPKNDVKQFISAANHVFSDDDNKLSSEDCRGENNKIKNELTMLNAIYSEHNQSQPHENNIPYTNDLLRFSKTLRRIPYARRAKWFYHFASQHTHSNQCGREDVEKFRDISFSFLNEVTSNSPNSFTIADISALKDISRLLVSLSYSLFNNTALYPSHTDEMGFDFYNNYAKEIEKSVIPETLDSLEKGLKLLNFNKSALGCAAKLIILLEISRMAPTDSERFITSRKEFLRQFIEIPKTDLANEEMLSLLFHGTITEPIYGWPNNLDLRQPCIKLVKHLKNSLELTNLSEAGTFQILTLACSTYIAADIDVDTNSTEAFERSFELSLELIKRGMGEIISVSDWLHVGARISCAMNLRGNANNRNDHKKGKSIDELYSQGWALTVDTFRKLADAASNTPEDAITVLYMQALAPIQRYTQSLYGPNGLDDFISRANDSLGEFTSEAKIIARYIWATSSINMGLTDRESGWDWLVSAYRAISKVPYHLSYALNDHMRHDKIYQELERHISWAPRGSLDLLIVATEVMFELMENDLNTEKNDWDVLTGLAISNVVTNHKLDKEQSITAKAFFQKLFYIDISHGEIGINELRNLWSKFLTQATH